LTPVPHLHSVPTGDDVRNEDAPEHLSTAAFASVRAGFGMVYLFGGLDDDPGPAAA
jgi:hypothetical protein